MRSVAGLLLLMIVAPSSACLANPGGPDEAAQRGEVIPLSGHRVRLAVDGVEKTVWNFSTQHPRPFFFPLRGPSGSLLTRIGHPGAPDHDHHLSVWFAHHDVAGRSFWQDGSGCVIRQKQWLTYQDSPEGALMAVLLDWQDSDGTSLLEQELVASLQPLADGEYELELQSRFSVPAGVQATELGKTNFGLLAVRVARSLSGHFGDGRLTSQAGGSGEREIFGTRAGWVDYSGAVLSGQGRDRLSISEGISFIDHPSNPRYPTHWHVREDGWMGASFCFAEGWTVTQEQPLQLRYLLYIHQGTGESERIAEVGRSFHERPAWRVRRAGRGEPHRHYVAERVSENNDGN